MPPPDPDYFLVGTWLRGDAEMCGGAGFALKVMLVLGGRGSPQKEAQKEGAGRH